MNIIFSWSHVPAAAACCSACAAAAGLAALPQAKKKKKEPACGMNENCAELLISGLGPQQAPPPPPDPGTLSGKGIFASALKYKPPGTGKGSGKEPA